MAVSESEPNFKKQFHDVVPEYTMFESGYLRDEAGFDYLYPSRRDPAA